MARIYLFISYIVLFQTGYSQIKRYEVIELDNHFFKNDPHWRGADGAATVDLNNGKLLWLFADTFIDREGTGRRNNATGFIRNSIGIQESKNDLSSIQYYYQGTKSHPRTFFKLADDSWFWPGHGIRIKDKLFVFLIEEASSSEMPGFQAVGWYVAIINNPDDEPSGWEIEYKKGADTFGVIVGSSAVLIQDDYVYAFGVKEPSVHRVHLFRFEKELFEKGDFISLEWRVNDTWINAHKLQQEPVSSSLFFGQTEFSVHHDPREKKYIQIQTYGFGNASIGIRTADYLWGPWSEKEIVYKPKTSHEKDFIYTANAHPEIYSRQGIVITYNVNNGNEERLLNNESIYFPEMVELQLNLNND